MVIHTPEGVKGALYMHDYFLKDIKEYIDEAYELHPISWVSFEVEPYSK